MLAACGHPGTSLGESPNGCARSPTTLSIAPKSGATLTVKVGAVVYVELVEAEKYLSWPAGTKPPPRVFPWAVARSSGPSVLRRVALCPSSGASTLPVVVYAFRALTPGTSTLTAPIAQAWKHIKPARRRGLHPYRATVIVASRSVGWHGGELKLLCAWGVFIRSGHDFRRAMERYSDARSAPPEQEQGRADPRAACNVTTPRRYSRRP